MFEIVFEKINAIKMWLCVSVVLTCKVILSWL